MFLIIDTSDKLYLALSKNSQIIDEYSGKIRRQSEKLLLSLDKLLKKNKVKLKDIKAIFVMIGPDSYTGLRVGVAVANSLAYGLEIPIVGIRSRPEKYGAGAGIKNIINKGEKLLKKAKPGDYIKPVYSQPPRISRKS